MSPCYTISTLQKTLRFPVQESYLISPSLKRTSKEQLIKGEMTPISFEANLSNWALFPNVPLSASTLC